MYVKTSPIRTVTILQTSTCPPPFPPLLPPSPCFPPPVDPTASLSSPWKSVSGLSTILQPNSQIVPFDGRPSTGSFWSSHYKQQIVIVKNFIFALIEGIFTLNIPSSSFLRSNALSHLVIFLILHTKSMNLSSTLCVFSTL